MNISEYAKIVLMNLLYLKTAWGNLDLNLTLDEFEFLNSDLSTIKKKFIVGKYQTGRMLEKTYIVHFIMKVIVDIDYIL